MKHHAHTRLQLQAVVATAEQAAEQLRTRAALTGEPIPQGDMEDHRTAIVCNLIDALDAVEPQLGAMLLKALYPFNSDEPAPAVAPTTASTCRFAVGASA